jgi:penicillin V acylase-like amidase (Ntn superfamily)
MRNSQGSIRRILPAALWAVLLLSLAQATDGRACTAFLIETGKAKVMGKSYDYDFGNGMVVFNKAGVSKQNLPYDAKEKPAAWTSAYASLTFNQYGREMPNGGINEKGLAVEILWLEKSVYEPADNRPVLNELQWVQYQLDSFATAKELAEHAGDNRLSGVYAKVHYMACDAGGACAVIEFLDGKPVVTSGKKLKVKTLANHDYAESLAFLKTHKGFGGKLAVPQGSSSLDRFVRAASLVRKKGSKKKDVVTRAFDILDSVRNGDFSKWNIVYDLAGKKVSFRTLGHADIKSVSLDGFDRDCAKPVKILDINADGKGDVAGLFKDYTSKANAQLSKESWDDLSGNFPPNVVQLALAFPESFTCASAAKTEKKGK